MHYGASSVVNWKLRNWPKWLLPPSTKNYKNEQNSCINFVLLKTLMALISIACAIVHWLNFVRMSNLHEYSSESFPYFFRLWKYSRKVTRRWHFAAACFLPLDQNRPLLGKPGEEWWKSILPLHLLLPHTTTGQRLNPLHFVVWRMVTTLFVCLLFFYICYIRDCLVLQLSAPNCKKLISKICQIQVFP